MILKNGFVTIYLIRHGRQNSKLCNVDVELAPEGMKQAALLGERLAGQGIQMVYSSGLIRAVQTAQAANFYWNVEYQVEPELREIDFGNWEGLSDEEIEKQFGNFKIELGKMKSDLCYPGGERAGDVVKRVMPVLNRIGQKVEDRVAVVTHGGVIRSVVAYILGMELKRYRCLGKSLENCSITELKLDRNSGIFTLERFNDYSHLEKCPELLRRGWKG